MSVEADSEENDALSLLSNFLSELTTIEHPRLRCPSCHGSRTIYCPDCLELFVPKEDWPESVISGTLQLPFQLDILMDDRKASSTGVQVATILKAAGLFENFRIYDLTDENESIPDYDNEANEEDGGTYLLFPDVSSVPLSSVLTTSNIKRIIVLDCKWTKFSKTLALPLHKALANIPRIHLDEPPPTSFYWRWHNAGDGAVSTVEAIYYAACQFQAFSNSPTQTSPRAFLDLFWLFRLQRNIIASRYEEEKSSNSRSVPFSKEGKEFQRELRQRQGKRLIMEQAHNLSSL
jgi:DTW domain-containing protein YfiP